MRGKLARLCKSLDEPLDASEQARVLAVYIDAGGHHATFCVAILGVEVGGIDFRASAGIEPATFRGG